MRRLGWRLSAVAEAVPKGARVADIGADHGALGAALLMTGQAAFVWAIDGSARALAGAQVALAEHVEAGRAEVLGGDGLDPLMQLGKAQQPDCVVLAGVGSMTVLGVLARSFAGNLLPARIIVQPSKDEAGIREGLLRMGYGLVDERIVPEGLRLFAVLVFDREGGIRSFDEPTDSFVGPILKGSRTEVYAAWLEIQEKWLRETIGSSDDPEDLACRRDRLRAVRALRR